MRPHEDLVEDGRMTDATTELLKAQLKQLRLPAMARELEKLSREAASANQSYEQFLLQLAEIELSVRAANALAARIKNADFPVLKDFDTYDFSALPNLPKPKLLELARGSGSAKNSTHVSLGVRGRERRTWPSRWARRRVVRVTASGSSRHRSWSAR